MRHTARGDAPEQPGSAMTRYYTNPGYPAGVWLGQGLAGLGDGSGQGLAAGAMVTEEQMARLFGAGHDPVTDAALGREYAKAAPVADRVAAKVAELPGDFDAATRAPRVAAIEAAERAKQSRASVAGFDMTFSVPKSVSVLWALSDAATQRMIVEAHHAAVATTLGLIETDVARNTRLGITAYSLTASIYAEPEIWLPRGWVAETAGSVRLDAPSARTLRFHPGLTTK